MLGDDRAVGVADREVDPAELVYSRSSTTVRVSSGDPPLTPQVKQALCRVLVAGVGALDLVRAQLARPGF